jgi:membrane dipeptidase
LTKGVLILKELFIILLITFALSINQNSAQTISGNVRDSYSEAPLNGVKVGIINNISGDIDSTSTNIQGNWQYTFSTSVINEDNLPTEFYIEQNYPNPFNPSTTIKFTNPKTQSVEILVHNILGELIGIKKEFLETGSYSIDWYSKGSAGVYFYTIKSSTYSETKKMVQLDGGAGKGFSDIKYTGSGSVSKQFKSQSLSVSLMFSRNDYVTDTTITEITGGENFNTLLTSVHRAAIMADLHNDILSKMLTDTSYHFANHNTYNHTDIPRLKLGGVDIQFFVAWVSPTQYPGNPYEKTIEMFDIFYNEAALNPDDLQIAFNPDEALSIIDNGKIAGVLCVEGGHSIENSIEKLADLYNLGMRYLTITWNNSTDWAVAAADPNSATVGLSEFGREVIRAMDSLGIIIDVSHTGIKTIEDILEVTTNPIIATHSGVRALRNHYRNLYDNQIIAIANSGGVIGVVFYPPFLSSNSSTVNINTVVQHINYIVNLVGVDYVAIGSDFDGIESTPAGLEDVSKFPALTLRLLQEGYSHEDVYKILGGNFLRVFNEVNINKKNNNLVNSR